MLTVTYCVFSHVTPSKTRLKKRGGGLQSFSSVRAKGSARCWVVHFILYSCFACYIMQNCWHCRDFKSARLGAWFRKCVRPYVFCKYYMCGMWLFSGMTKTMHEVSDYPRTWSIDTVKNYHHRRKLGGKEVQMPPLPNFFYLRFFLTSELKRGK